MKKINWGKVALFAAVFVIWVIVASLPDYTVLFNI